MYTISIISTLKSKLNILFIHNVFRNEVISIFFLFYKKNLGINKFFRIMELAQTFWLMKKLLRLLKYVCKLN